MTKPLTLPAVAMLRGVVRFKLIWRCPISTVRPEAVRKICDLHRRLGGGSGQKEQQEPEAQIVMLMTDDRAGYAEKMVGRVGAGSILRMSAIFHHIVPLL